MKKYGLWNVSNKKRLESVVMSFVSRKPYNRIINGSGIVRTPSLAYFSNSCEKIRQYPRRFRSHNENNIATIPYLSCSRSCLASLPHQERLHRGSPRAGDQDCREESHRCSGNQAGEPLSLKTLNSRPFLGFELYPRPNRRRIPRFCSNLEHVDVTVDGSDRERHGCHEQEEGGI